MREARVLFVVNDFPPMLGGEATLYYGLARHLSRGEAVIMAPRAREDHLVNASLSCEVARRWFPAHRGIPSRVARGLVASWHLSRLLGGRSVDYLLCGQLLSLGVPTRILARAHGLPYAVFVHGADLSDYHDRWAWGALARWVIAGADLVLANSQFTRGMIERLLPGAARRIVVLPMGVDPPRQPSRETIDRLRRRHQLGEGPVLLSVSRLIAIKGHDVVIRALPDLAARFPDLKYVIVGDGPHRGALERLARECDVAGRVTFAGSVPAEEIAAHYGLATLFVQLSRRGEHHDGVEGFGLSFLEAASYGVPAIAGRSGGVPEAVEDGQTGLLVAPEDAGAFTAAAARLLGDPVERSRMSQAARRWAVGHPWDRAARCLLAAIHRRTASNAPVSPHRERIA